MPSTSGPQMKRKGTRRALQDAIADQAREHSGGFQDGDAAAAIVIRARARMIEMTAVIQSPPRWGRCRE